MTDDAQKPEGGADDVSALLADAAAQVKALRDRCRQAVFGRTVRITSNYNGQPYGRSKRSLKGETRRVVGLILDANGVFLVLEDEQCSIKLNEVEFLPPTTQEPPHD